MNTNIVFYQKPIHEFNTLTTPLSLIELGAFTKLIDYLILNQSLPNTDRRYFLLNIKKKPEKRALDFVINEFCFINDDGDLECDIANNIISKTINTTEKFSNLGKISAAKRSQIINQKKQENSTARSSNINNNSNNNININNNNNKTHSNQNNINSDTAENSQNLCGSVVNFNSNNSNNAVSTATQICVDLRKHGLASVNPSYPKLQKAVELGATPEMFVNAYNDLKAQHKTIKSPFPYIVATVINQITEAQTIKIKPKNYFDDSTRNRPKFTQQQKSDITAKMSNLEITNRPYLSVLLENGYTPELKENDDYTYTLLTIEEIQQKAQQFSIPNSEATQIIDVSANSADDLFQLSHF